MSFFSSLLENVAESLGLSARKATFEKKMTSSEERQEKERIKRNQELDNIIIEEGNKNIFDASDRINTYKRNAAAKNDMTMPQTRERSSSEERVAEERKKRLEEVRHAGTDGIVDIFDNFKILYLYLTII